MVESWLPLDSSQYIQLGDSYCCGAMSVQEELASLDRLDDRIVSTSNERLTGTLRAILPKLVLLVNKEELRVRNMNLSVYAL